MAILYSKFSGSVASPSLKTNNTGLIGAVGIDESHRKYGIGLALICHAIENMKQRLLTINKEAMAILYSKFSGSVASPSLKTNLLIPPGAVGIDESHRKYGIGLALICHAIENMKQRGIEGVFVDC
jgi:ribosomal protein S18 acetylase RimI-like enzyme